VVTNNVNKFYSHLIRRARGVGGKVRAQGGSVLHTSQLSTLLLFSWLSHSTPESVSRCDDDVRVMTSHGVTDMYSGVLLACYT